MLKGKIKGTAFQQQCMWNLISASHQTLLHNPSMIVSLYSAIGGTWMVGFRCDTGVEQGFLAHRVKDFLQPTLLKRLTCPGTPGYFPLLLGSVLKLGNLMHLWCQQTRCLPSVCVSLPPDTNPVMISLLEQVERGKRLRAQVFQGH